MADITVDARGLLCPIPILRLEKALRREPRGTVLRLLATDPAAVEDVRAFCQETGHGLLEERHEGEVLIFRVRKA
jgi:tRNA 2-thiouridine synthesizing protein A